MSPKTVQANLTRIYRKLGIRSRAELGARMADERRQGRAAEVAERPIPPHADRPTVEPLLKRKEADVNLRSTLIAGALLAVSAVTAFPVQASPTAAALEPTSLQRAQTIRAQIDARYRSRTWSWARRHRGDLDRSGRVVHAPDAGPARDAVPPG